MITPGGTWSHTLGNDLEICDRRVYYRVYGSWGGWSRTADRETRDTYMAKNAQTLPMHAGGVVHECIQNILQAMRMGRGTLLGPTIANRMRNRFLSDVEYSRDRKWRLVDSPKNATLICIDHLRGSDVSQEFAERQAQNVYDALIGFFEHHLPWIESLGGATAILQVEALDAVQHLGFSLYVVPDLLLAPALDRRILVDWKTGRNPDVGQLKVYALYIRLKTPLIPASNIEGRSIPLRSALSDSAVCTMTDEDIQSAFSRIDGHIARLKALHEPGLHKNKLAFAKTEHRGSCSECLYRHICDLDE